VKSGRQKGGQALSQRVDEPMGHVLRAGAKLKHRKNLGAGIDRQPQPQHLCGAAQPGSKFVQLQVREVQVAEAALMEELSVPARTGEPGRDRGLSVAKNPFSRPRIEPFGQCRQDHGDLLRGSFQTVQRRVAPRTERGAAGLTPMCVVCQEGKNLPFFDRQSGLKTKNRAS
jgi:hypothetical protein